MLRAGLIYTVAVLGAICSELGVAVNVPAAKSRQTLIV